MTGARVYTKPLKGHKLTLSWSGEYGVESSSTASCVCGWQESASNQEECRHEYRCHLQDERERLVRCHIAAREFDAADAVIVDMPAWVGRSEAMAALVAKAREEAE